MYFFLHYIIKRRNEAQLHKKYKTWHGNVLVSAKIYPQTECIVLDVTAACRLGMIFICAFIIIFSTYSTLRKTHKV